MVSLRQLGVYSEVVVSKTYKDRPEYRKRPRRRDKRRTRLDEITQENEIVRDGHLYYSDSTERHPRRLRFEEQYDTPKAKDEGSGKGIDTTPRESTRDVRDIGLESQDGRGSGRADN